MPFPRSQLAVYNAEQKTHFEAEQAKKVTSKPDRRRVKGKGKSKTAPSTPAVFERALMTPGNWRESRRIYQWDERAFSWDQAEVVRKANDFAHWRAMQRDRELAAAGALYDKGHELLELEMKDYVDNLGNPAITPPAKYYETAAKLMDEGQNQARAALEMADRRTANEFNFAGMTDDELISFILLQLREIIGSVTGREKERVIGQLKQLAEGGGAASVTLDGDHPAARTGPD
jgi:hypothetical protein